MLKQQGVTTEKRWWPVTIEGSLNHNLIIRHVTTHKWRGHASQNYILLISISENISISLHGNPFLMKMGTRLKCSGLTLKLISLLEINYIQPTCVTHCIGLIYELLFLMFLKLQVTWTLLILWKARQAVMSRKLHCHTVISWSDFMTSYQFLKRITVMPPTFQHFMKQVWGMSTSHYWPHIQRQNNVDFTIALRDCYWGNYCLCKVIFQICNFWLKREKQYPLAPSNNWNKIETNRNYYIMITFLIFIRSSLFTHPS